MKQSPSVQHQRIGYYPEQPHREPPKKPQKDYLRIAVLVICVSVFLICFFLLARYAVNILISRSASNKLENVYTAAQETVILQNETPTAEFPTATPTVTSTPTSTPTAVRTVAPTQTPVPSVNEIWPKTYANNPTLRVTPIFYQLQAQNRDIIGWIKIDGVLEEAVVQRDNSYYLTHNALRQKSVTGALFLDEICDLETVPTQLIVHGHNMKEGAMFGSLKKYKVKDASYYREHPFIEFNTIYENARYVIFAVAEVDIRSGKPDYLPFWHHSRFNSVSAFTEYVERAKLLSHYRCNVDVQPGDRLLTLSTCTGTDDNKRLIVMARQIRADENELELNYGIHSTTDR